MARQSSYGINKADLSDLANSTSGVKLGHAGLERPIPNPEPTLGLGQRNPGIAPAPSPNHVAPLQAVNPNQVSSPSTTKSPIHASPMSEVSIEAPEKKITEVREHMISPPPSAATHTKPPGGYGKGTTYAGYNRGLSQHTNDLNYQRSANPPVYRKSAIANTGEEIPMGSTGQSPKDQLAHVSGRTGMSAAQSIGQHGSIPDIQSVEKITGKPTPGLTPDVRQAVNQSTMPSANMAPLKKKGR